MVRAQKNRVHYLVNQNIVALKNIEVKRHVYEFRLVPRRMRWEGNATCK
jgi:hypothetical protein